MDIQYKRSLYTMILFLSLLVFLIIDMIVVGPSRFSESLNLLASASVVFAVFIGFYAMLLRTKKDVKIIDERDRMIRQKASTIALASTTMYVFLLTISLYSVYDSGSTVPVGWMWFIAYSTYAFAFISTSGLSVLLYRKD